MHNSLYMLKIRRQRAIELRKMNKKAAPTTLISSLRAVNLRPFPVFGLWAYLFLLALRKADKQVLDRGAQTDARGATQFT
jgi:hypothetical protein